MCWCWDIYYDIRGLILSLPEEMRLSFTTEPGRGSSASDRYHIGLSQNKEKDKISDIQRRCKIKGGDSYSYNAVLAKRQSSPGRSERRSLSISCCILHISVAFGHSACSTTSAAALGVHSPSAENCVLIWNTLTRYFFDQGQTGELKMSGGPADLPTLLEEVRDMADRGGIMMMVVLV